jgi:hypothetical protein
MGLGFRPKKLTLGARGGGSSASRAFVPSLQRVPMLECLLIEPRSAITHRCVVTSGSRSLHAICRWRLFGLNSRNPTNLLCAVADQIRSAIKSEAWGGPSDGMCCGKTSVAEI